MNMNFKTWLQTEALNDFSMWKDIIVGALELHPQNGLSQTLDTMNKENLKSKLQGLSEFAKLPPEHQQRVLGFIDGPQSGTVGDLIRQIAGQPRMSM